MRQLQVSAIVRYHKLVEDIEFCIYHLDLQSSVIFPFQFCLFFKECSWSLGYDTSSGDTQFLDLSPFGSNGG